MNKGKRKVAEAPTGFGLRTIGYIATIVLWERRTGVYWYNPKSRSSERVAAPSTDEEAIQMLSGHPDSASFVSEYAELRHSGMEIEPALTLVGHEFRLRYNEHLQVRQANHEWKSRSRPRASGYELLLAVRLREEGREGRNRRSVYRSW